MSWYTYIAADVPLENNKKHIKPKELWITNDDKYWFYILEDYFKFEELRRLLDKKFVYEISDGIRGYNFNWSKQICKNFEETISNGSYPTRVFTAEEIERDLLRSYASKNCIIKLFEYLRKVLPKGANAKIYTLYCNDPVFVPEKIIELDLKTFEIPDEFEFGLNELWILKN